MSRMTIEKNQFEALNDLYDVCQGEWKPGEPRNARITKFDVMGVNNVLFLTVEIEPLKGTDISRLSGATVRYEFVILEDGLTLFNHNGLKPVTNGQWREIGKGAYWEKNRSADNEHNS